MIIEGKSEPMPHETTAFTVAIANLPIIPTRDSRKAIQIIKKLDGFYGIHPAFPHGTLLLFKTENDAKRAKNILESEGIKTGDNICKVFIPKEYTREI